MTPFFHIRVLRLILYSQKLEYFSVTKILIFSYWLICHLPPAKKFHRKREEMKLAPTAYNCFLLLSLPLLGPFRFPFLILSAVFIPLQPFMLICFIAVIPGKQNLIIRPTASVCMNKKYIIFWEGDKKSLG